MSLLRGRRILVVAFLGATLGAIGVAIYLSLDPKNYYFGLGQDRADWVYDSRQVLLTSGLMLAEAVCAGAALFSPRPHVLWLRCLLGLLVLVPWALRVTPFVIHMPSYFLFHHLWLWLLVFTLTLACLSSMTRSALLFLRRGRLTNRWSGPA